MKRWSKLQKQLYQIIDDKIKKITEAGKASKT